MDNLQTEIDERKELLAYFQKQIEWKISENQRYGTTLWVLITATGIILFQLFTILPNILEETANLNNLFLTTVNSLNIAVIIYSLFFMFFGEKEGRPIYYKRDVLMKMLSFLLIHILIVVALLCINGYSCYIYIEALKASTTKIETVLYQFYIFAYSIYIIIYFVNLVMAGRYYFEITLLGENKFRLINRFFIKPELIWIKYMSNSILFSAFIGFVFMNTMIFCGLNIWFFSTVNILKMEILLISLICLLIYIIKQCVDRMTEAQLIKDANNIMLTNETIFEMKHDMQILLGAETIYNWKEYICQSINFKKETIQYIEEKHKKCSLLYKKLNKLELDKAVVDEKIKYIKYYVEVLKFIEILKNEYCINKEQKMVLSEIESEIEKINNDIGVN